MVSYANLISELNNDVVVVVDDDGGGTGVGLAALGCCCWDVVGAGAC